MNQGTTGGTSDTLTGGTAGGTAQQPAAQAAALADDDQLARLSDALDSAAELGTPAEVHVYKLTGGRRELVGRFTGENFDAFTLAERYGGGRFIARSRIGGRWGPSATFSAAAAAVVEAPTMTRAAASTTPASSAAGMFTPEGMLGLIMSQANQQTQMLTGLLTAVLQKPAETPKLSELAALMRPASGLGEVVGALEALERMRGGDQGGGGDGLGELAGILAPAFAAAHQPARPAARPAMTRAVRPALPDRAALAMAARGGIARGRMQAVAALARAMFALSFPASSAATVLRHVLEALKLDPIAAARSIGEALHGKVSHAEAVYAFAVYSELSKSSTTPTPATAGETAADRGEETDDDGDDGEELDGEELDGEELEAEQPEPFDPR
jgi:hypothetical protein